MALQSDLFKNDRMLQACQDSHAGNLHPKAGARATGEHISKIQEALRRLDGAVIDPAEITAKRYGASTAAAVLSFKKKRTIVNRSYQAKPDNVVGWDHVGEVNGLSGVYLGNGWVITANHVGAGNFTLAGVTYLWIPGSETQLDNQSPTLVLCPGSSQAKPCN